jgi:FlaG/FlaF family flagellin (archaellin)
MRKFVKSAEAVSPILAVLIMIIITVAAGLVTFAWAMGYLGFTTSKAAKSIQIQSVANSGPNLLVYVQNVGDGVVELDDTGAGVVYVDGVLKPCTVDPADGKLGEGRTATLTIAGEAVPLGETATVKVTAMSGGNVIFIEKTLYEGA